MKGQFWIVAFLVLLMPVVAVAEVLDGWRIMQISATDGIAVAKSPAGALRLVREGDRLGDYITVTGFEGGRMILDAPGYWGRMTLFVRVVDGLQQVDRREMRPMTRRSVTGEAAAIVAE
ncbi:MAG: hypothetical protein FDZ69_02050 [Deltaproteobacteria bacterium]|nr:MAG: hypothetical protein FDZ69_02050 [Deltaproteobacteria bacterium]